MNTPLFNWPLMHNNVSRQDLDSLILYLTGANPRLTHGPQVQEFEREWAQWVGTSEAVMVNSGSSANDLTLLALREMCGDGEVILSPLGWVSDVAAILHAGLRPVFVDIDPITLGPASDQVLDRLSSQTRATLIVHVLGLNALTPELVQGCHRAGVPVIEDVCESHGALFEGARCGSVGYASNFSFYFAHHMTTIEGGAICTSDPEFADVVRMLRSHGLVRESRSEKKKAAFQEAFPDLNSEFIFAHAAHNNRPTELNGVLGRSQLRRLDANIEIRKRNFRRFMAQLDPTKYKIHFDVDSSSNYAFIVVLQEPDWGLRDKVEIALRHSGIEYRRGLSGGGSQLRQPYLQPYLNDVSPTDFPNVEHIHNFGWYIGNHPGVSGSDVDRLCELLNET